MAGTIIPPGVLTLERVERRVALLERKVCVQGLQTRIELLEEAVRTRESMQRQIDTLSTVVKMQEEVIQRLCLLHNVDVIFDPNL